ncbi:hypothetical protein GQ43DRAFT_364220 [Delitschia confertaspora ATCC 74209]|uniref:Uncharacterized protein n=1 Tax=Delitschia confertaspora ATCC 74209 TaxID=1513339 RepID=A0A9P4N2B7_9PLEO|nr:hypothetical protein GQ43DRAFT_364220 [Delitschia confertaspora ATCC 74209]
MLPPPLLSPMRPGKLPFDGTHYGPFKSIGKPFDPFRTIPQVPYVQVSVEEMKHHCSQVFGTRAMGLHWIPTLIKSPHAFLSTLCIASAHMDAINNRSRDSIQTIALQQEVIHKISQHFVNPSSQVDDFNIIAVTQLICSEIITGNDTVLKYHEPGVEKMVLLRGGLDKLGVNGRLASTLTWVSLESAILRESKPRNMYLDYATDHPCRPYPNTATIPESPLWCPRSDFETIKRSPRSTQQMVDMLKDVRQMTKVFLEEDKFTSEKQRDQQLRSLYRKITFPSTLPEVDTTTVRTPREWAYEVCRVAAVIQATAMVKRVPLSEAFVQIAQSHIQMEPPIQIQPSPSLSLSTPTTQNPSISPFRIDSPVHSLTSHFDSHQPPFLFTTPPTSHSHRPPKRSPSSALLTHIRTCLENSDLSDAWSDLTGVLYWITLILGAASSTANNASTTYGISHLEREEGVVNRKWIRALGVRCAIRLCFQHEDPVLKTLRAAVGVVQTCADGGRGERMVVSQGQGGGRQEQGMGKRRRL